MGISKYEQETIICFNEEEPTAEIYTASPRMIAKYLKLAAECPVVTVKNQTEDTLTIICPKKMVKVLKPRQLSDETKKKLAERMKSIAR